MRALATVFLAVVMLACVSTPSAAGDPASPPTLSPGLLDLFRAEMRELLNGSQAIAAALPLGDWARIAETARRMQASYVLEQKLTAAQRKELGALPERFLALDADFHARTQKLADAALRHDAEAVAFHYGRLLEGCVSCHAAYAPARFPTLAAPRAEPHAH